MRVGLSLITHVGQNIWNNGIGQNVYFLAQCIDAIPFVEQVIIINCGDQDTPPASAGDLGAKFPLVSAHDAIEAVDVAIEMAGAFGPEWKRAFKAKGGKIAFHNCGQPYAALIEPHVFSQPGCFVEPELSDEVWLLPKDSKFARMQGAFHRCPVHEVPYLWGPDFLLNSGDLTTDIPFGYQPGSLTDGNLRPAIFEPNISPIKMGTIPLLICEVLERRHPNLISSVTFLNGSHLMDTHTFSYMLKNLNLHASKKIEVRGREYFSDVMRSGANIVVSHQLEVTQNYLYLDSIYGNYPLLHNSPDFQDIGYYYRDSDVEEAVEMADWIVRFHDQEAEAYNSRSKQRLAKLSPSAPQNIDSYARRLLALTAPRTPPMACYS